MKTNYTYSKKSLLNTMVWCFSLFLSFSSVAQNLNFTIDTAVDNGTDITETIVNGSDTYVLTVAHSGNEELDNLGGGDLVFFLSAIDPLTPHSLKITKNGNLINFKLNSIDYDTLGAGTISVRNQDDEVISSPTFYPLGAGSLFISNPTNGFDITEIRIFPTDTDDLNDFGFHNINIDILDTLGVDESTLLENHVTIFPNPSNGDITLKNSTIALEKVVVSDLNGRTIVTQNLNGVIGDHNLEMSSELSAGLYLITISSEKGSAVKKIIIK
ncbi:T9SS type A sorting domain-containing protein [Psychroserpens luteolus]|uniref:T9SS type A sorting domain-containing protein n=1 Tax=Psychroserpens luteolus TaxID=2855840 RepID=UPI001E592A66|nr:T9SS type A sorting domain-containing protein [Psychroserpens luteolus]MCD2257902.1 T9SS type A sorting domain-containing protein [Psychroserpens luteolus]